MVMKESLILEMHAKLDRYNANVRQAMRMTQTEGGKAGSALKRVESNAVSLEAVGSKALKLFGGVAISYLGVRGVQAVTAYADSFTNLQNKLKVVQKPTEDLQATTSALLKVANDTRSSLDSTVTLYSRLARNSDQLGLSQRELIDLTSTINKSFALSGATAAEAGAAIVQLSQGLASGTLRGDEFNSVAEQAPILLEAVAKSLKVNKGQLREMAAQGKITAEVLIKAIQDYAKAVDNDFAKSQSTVAQAHERLNNNMTILVGTLDKLTGATDLYKAAITGLSEALSDINRDFDDNKETTGLLGQSWTALGGAIAVTLEALDGLLSAGALDTVGDALAGAVVEAERLNQTLLGMYQNESDEPLIKGPFFPEPDEMQQQVNDFKAQFQEMMSADGGLLGSGTATDETAIIWPWGPIDPEKYKEQIAEVSDVIAEMRDEMNESAGERLSAEKSVSDTINDLLDGQIAKEEKHKTKTIQAKRDAAYLALGIIGGFSDKARKLQEAYFAFEQAKSATSILMSGAEGGEKAIAQMGPAGIPVAAGIIAAAATLASNTSSLSIGSTSIAPTSAAPSITTSDVPRETQGLNVSLATDKGSSQSQMVIMAPAGDTIGEALAEWINEGIKKGKIG